MRVALGTRRAAGGRALAGNLPRSAAGALTRRTRAERAPKSLVPGRADRSVFTIEKIRFHYLSPNRSHGCPFPPWMPSLFAGHAWPRRASMERSEDSNSIWPRDRSRLGRFSHEVAPAPFGRAMDESW